MDTTKALQLLPARWRLRIYLTLGSVALLLTALGAFFLASPWPVPWWIAAALAGVGVLAGPFAILAGNNVSADQAPATRVDVTAPVADVTQSVRKALGDMSSRGMQRR